MLINWKEPQSSPALDWWYSEPWKKKGKWRKKSKQLTWKEWICLSKVPSLGISQSIPGLFWYSINILNCNSNEMCSHYIFINMFQLVIIQCQNKKAVQAHKVTRTLILAGFCSCRKKWENINKGGGAAGWRVGKENNLSGSRKEVFY